jgi:RNA recognition motif-containing protein
MSTSIFIGNIPYGAMEAEIRDLFSTCGTVQDVHFIMDYRKGRFRGFGFVTMPKKDAALAISKLNGVEFQGRNLKVSEAQPGAESKRHSA